MPLGASAFDTSKRRVKRQVQFAPSIIYEYPETTGSANSSQKSSLLSEINRLMSYMNAHGQSEKKPQVLPGPIFSYEDTSNGETDMDDYWFDPRATIHPLHTPPDSLLQSAAPIPRIIIGPIPMLPQIDSDSEVGDSVVLESSDSGISSSSAGTAFEGPNKREEEYLEEEEEYTGDKLSGSVAHASANSGPQRAYPDVERSKVQSTSASFDGLSSQLRPGDHDTIRSSSLGHAPIMSSIQKRFDAEAFFLELNNDDVHSYKDPAQK